MKNDLNHIQEDVNKINPNEGAVFFKLLLDSTRIKIFYSLLKKELCVQDLTVILNASTSLISHRLRQLKAHRIVKQRRERRYVYYSLDDEHIASVISIANTHINHN